MRYLFGFICVCALGLMPLLGCETAPSALECESAEDCTDENECTADACTGGVCSNTPAENGAACSDGACMDSVCTAVAVVSGSVFEFGVDSVESPAVGATVSVRGTSISTTTDAFAQFALSVPVGTVFFQTSQDGAWGWIERWPVAEDGIMNLEFAVVADALVTQIENELQVEVDESKGVVEPFFDGVSGLGGETAALSEQHEFGITANADGDWVLSDVVLPGVSEPWIAFLGVDVTDALTVEPKGVDGENTCRLGGPRDTPPPPPNTVYPVVAKFFTIIEVDCTPVR
jgi:hypothetical protein